MHFSEDYVYKITLAIGIEIASVKSSHFNDALEALSNLCKVQGDAFDQHTDVIDLINVLFRDGLSNELIKTLEELSKIKGKMYKKPIQVKLLNVISLVLSDKQFSFSKNIAQYRKHSDEGSSRFGRENSLESGSILLFPNEAKSTLKELDSMNKETMRKLMNKDVDKKVKEIVQSESREMMIILALATLSNFDFSDFAESLTHFFDEWVLNYLDNPDEAIREAAVKTCSNLTISQQGNRIGSVLEKILKKLLKKFLIVATTDPSHSIRCNMLKHLGNQFDYYLASKENLLMLFNCMNDPSFEIREKTLRILGRLADSNKSVMYPYLRNILVSLMSTIEYKGEPQEKEEAIKILNTFIKRCKRVVKDHVESLLKSLLNKMYEKDFSTSLNNSLMPDIIEAIGQLSTIDGKPMVKYLENLVPLILDCIKDEIAPRKREIGLKVLTMIIENTGYVVRPYFHYPELIQLISSLVQNETNFSIRKLVYKLLGTIGALDPYLISKILVFISVEEDEELVLNLPLLKEIDILNKYGNTSSIKDLSKSALMRSKEINSESLVSNQKTDNTRVPLEQLGIILENQSLGDIHKTVLDSYIYIFKKLKNETKWYLKFILPPLLTVIRKTSDVNVRKEAFDVLKTLIIQIKEHTARYSASIFSMINEFLIWDPLIGDKSSIKKSTLHSSTKHTSSLSEILDVIGALNTYAYAYVKDYIYFLIPKIMQIVEKSKKSKSELAAKAISLLITIQSKILDDYLYLIIPEMINICSKNNSKLMEMATALIIKVIRWKHFEEYIVQIVHSFIKILDESNNKTLVVKFLLDIAHISGQNLFRPFILLVLNAFKRNKINEEEYESELQTLSNNSTYTSNSLMFDETDEKEYIQEERLKTIEQLTEESSKIVDDTSLRKEKNYNFPDLIKEFHMYMNCKIPEDWIEWLKKTSYHLLKQNPSPLLYACGNVAEMHLPIISELYNIAFVMCFKHLNDKEKEEIITCLIQVINNIEVPVMVLQTILNLAEFLEREEELKLFSPTTLANVALRCNASAKALYYREKDFDRNRYENVDSLISINFDLQQPEAANGLLKLMQDESHDLMKEDWYLKLHEWSEALNIFEQKGDDLNIDDILGKLQCYTSLSDWEKVSDTVELLWEEELKANDKENEQSDDFNKNKIAEYASYAAWNLNDWGKFEEYVKQIDDNEPYSKYFFRSVIWIQKNKYREAEKFIDKCRELIDPTVKSLMGESYRRAYPCILELQYLKELEEIIEYKKGGGEEEVRNHFKDLWSYRLKFMAQDVESLQKTLNLRSLVIDTSEDTNHYVTLAELCNKKGNPAMCKRILTNLKGDIENNLAAYPKEQLFNISKVNFGLLKLDYSQGYHDKAIKGLNVLLSTEKRKDSDWYITLGQWQKEVNERKGKLNSKDFKEIISHFEKATDIDKRNNLAWHFYALANYEASKLLEFTNNLAKKDGKAYSDEYLFYVVSAVKGLIQSISLGEQDITKTLQDTLRLLKLWFKHGSEDKIDKLIKSGFSIVGVEVWTQVIPQLLARIDINTERTKNTMIELLKIICDTYPQAMIYPVSVLSQSNTETRKQVAQELIEMMRRNQKMLINQALKISRELIRAAVLQPESWCEALEEAAMMYFGNNDEKKMLEVLKEQYKTFNEPPQTLSEIAFQQNYRCELMEAWDWINKPEPSQEDLLQAWDIYHRLFMRLNKKLKEVTFYELKNVAPLLLEINSTVISVPGIYRCNQKLITIYKFTHSLQVLKSKQLPRKISMYGNDGKEYCFLLKGREDIRQDERSMQLFGLVNTLLAVDPVTQRKDLSIRRYSAIPLSFNAGLLGWVTNTDTLHQVIKDYRAQNKIIQSIELKLIDSMCKHFENWPSINKVEIFETVLDKTIGEDLQKMLWLNSPNSESWLERRANFTRSLAVMSMVGYILGLGDRHPSNIMLDRFSGKIVHIDFGDWFEIAMRREKFPEKIPFRLTRMLIKAMEVSGIEGNYRTTCENTMRVLRASKDSLMAILEAFVYDPLISFKLLAQNLMKTNKTEESKDQNRSKSPSKIAKESPNGKKKEAISKIKHSIVDHVLTRMKENNFHEGNFSRMHDMRLAGTIQISKADLIHQESINIKSVFNGAGGEVIKEEEEILNETAEVVVERIDSK